MKGIFEGFAEQLKLAAPNFELQSGRYSPANHVSLLAPVHAV
jgi:hypothetical protein